MLGMTILNLPGKGHVSLCFRQLDFLCEASCEHEVSCECEVSCAYEMWFSVTVKHPA